MLVATIATIVVSVCGLMLCGCAYMLIRNEWVYRVRGRMIAYCYERDPMQWIALGEPDPDWFLPSYDAMLYGRFWVWDASKFLLRPMDLDERPSQSPNARNDTFVPTGGR